MGRGQAAGSGFPAAGWYPDPPRAYSVTAEGDRMGICSASPQRGKRFRCPRSSFNLPQPVRQEVLMPDTEALIERLTQENHDFYKLHDDHRKYDEELATLNGRGFLSSDQQWRVSELKKLKLIAKDRMESIIRHTRSTMHA